MLINRIVGLSISDTTEASLVAMRQGNFPGSAKKRWLDFLFGQIPGKKTPLSQTKGLSFLFQDLSRILIR